MKGLRIVYSRSCTFQKIISLCYNRTIIKAALFVISLTLYSNNGHPTGNGHCLGFRNSLSKPYSWLRYNDVLTRARNFGSGLILLGLQPSPQTFLGIYSDNCPAWVITEQAAYSYSMVLVSLNDTLGPDACAFIINQGSYSQLVHSFKTVEIIITFELI